MKLSYVFNYLFLLGVTRNNEVNKLSIFGGTISNLERGLDFSATKQKAIAQNIANVDTPNYKTKTVNFDTYLSDAKKSTISAYRTTEKHINFDDEN